MTKLLGFLLTAALCLSGCGRRVFEPGPLTSQQKSHFIDMLRSLHRAVWVSDRKGRFSRREATGPRDEVEARMEAEVSSAIRAGKCKADPAQAMTLSGPDCPLSAKVSAGRPVLQRVPDGMTKKDLFEISYRVRDPAFKKWSDLESFQLEGSRVLSETKPKGKRNAMLEVNASGKAYSLHFGEINLKISERAREIQGEKGTGSWGSETIILRFRNFSVSLMAGWRRGDKLNETHYFLNSERITKAEFSRYWNAGKALLDGVLPEPGGIPAIAPTPGH